MQIEDYSGAVGSSWTGKEIQIRRSRDCELKIRAVAFRNSGNIVVLWSGDEGVKGAVCVGLWEVPVRTMCEEVEVEVNGQNCSRIIGPKRMCFQKLSWALLEYEKIAGRAISSQTGIRADLSWEIVGKAIKIIAGKRNGARKIRVRVLQKIVSDSPLDRDLSLGGQDHHPYKRKQPLKIHQLKIRWTQMHSGSIAGTEMCSLTPTLDEIGAS